MACRRVVLHTAVTLDGFVARLDGSIDWLNSLPPDNSYENFLKTCDTTLMGSNTFTQVRGFVCGDGVGFPYVGLKNYVFSKRKIETGGLDVTISDEDPVQLVKSLKAMSGKDIHLIGGGKLNATLLEAGLVDQMVLTYVPVVIGTGIRLFEGMTKEFTQWFTEVSCKSFAGDCVQVTAHKKSNDHK